MRAKKDAIANLIKKELKYVRENKDMVCLKDKVEKFKEILNQNGNQEKNHKFWFKEIRDHAGKSYGLFNRFESKKIEAYYTKSSEMRSQSSTQTSFVNSKEYLGVKSVSPSYIMRSKERECLTPDFMKPLNMDLNFAPIKPFKP